MKSICATMTAIACLTIPMGCCKGLARHDQAPSATQAEVANQPSALTESGEHTAAAVTPSPSEDVTKDSQDVKTEEMSIEEDKANSFLPWMSLFVVASLVGWLAYKFIFRKR